MNSASHSIGVLKLPPVSPCSLAHLGYEISDQTVGNILKRRGIPTAPERRKTTTWKACIRTHMDVLWDTDFFTTEVWTLGGLVTYDILFFIHLESRQVHIAGVTSHPHETWMMQMARNLTMEEWGILKPGQYLIHDRDTKFCAAFKQMLDDAGVKRVPLPPRTPWLNAYAERWIQSVKTEVLSQMILFGERSLRHALSEYVAHYRTERPHQGKGNVILFPSAKAKPEVGLADRVPRAARWAAHLLSSQGRMNFLTRQNRARQQ